MSNLENPEYSAKGAVDKIKLAVERQGNANQTWRAVHIEGEIKLLLGCLGCC
jgi:hypothetical protein